MYCRVKWPVNFTHIANKLCQFFVTSLWIFAWTDRQTHRWTHN